jgi:hypothetical protein
MSINAIELIALSSCSLQDKTNDRIHTMSPGDALHIVIGPGEAINIVK